MKYDVQDQIQPSEYPMETVVLHTSEILYYTLLI